VGHIGIGLVVVHVQGKVLTPLTVVTMVRSAMAVNRTVEFAWIALSLGPLNWISVRFIAGIKCRRHSVNVGSSDSVACRIRCRR
jgi:hypothetical protein